MKKILDFKYNLGDKVRLIKSVTGNNTTSGYLSKYGFCSGCDLLQSIQHYNDGLPDEEQISQHMTLCLHLLQRCKKPFSLED